jgi:hypothetical protein
LNRIRTTILWLALGAAIASLFWWIERPRAAYDISVRDVRNVQESLLDLRDRVMTLAKDVQSQGRAQPEVAGPASRPGSLDPRSAPDGLPNDEIAARLASIEATLAKLAQQQSAAPAPVREKPGPVERPALPPPKTKDQSLVDDLLAKGAKEPGANTRTYFGLTPREIHQTFGMPDHTKWDTAAGHHDWFYSSENGSTALQVRFEGGIVIGLWP